LHLVANAVCIRRKVMTPRSQSAFSEPVPEKVNYRAIGRGTGGVIKKRRPIYSRDVDSATPASMPTKYQNVLHRDNLEKKGFSSRTTRFLEPRGTEVPGPGAYAEIPFAQEAPTPRASSQGPVQVLRGRGAFASRTPRLPHASKAQGFVPPGPGAYQQEEVKKEERPTPVFQLPGAGNPWKYYEAPAPGPGYFLGTDGGVPPIGWTAVASAFGQEKRGGAQSDSGPGPGSYEQALDKESLRATTFASSQQHALQMEEKFLATEGKLRRKGLEILQDEKDTKQLGPGEYTPRINAVRGRSHFNVKGHSSFQIGLSQCPRKMRSASPGPGEYFEGISEQLEAPSSPLNFMISATDRFKEGASLAPGPAYYSPQKKTGKQSFHLNLQNNWT